MDKQFIGRSRQLNILSQAYQEVITGQGCRVKFIKGQSGSGKTQLYNQFLENIDDPALILRAACFSQANLEEAYYPFKELLSSVVNNDKIKNTRSEASGKILLKITQELLGSASELASAFIPSWKLIQSVSTFALEETGVLEKIRKKVTGASISVPDNLDKDKIVDQISSFLRASSNVTPIVVVIDDMQWMDEDSISLLHKLLTTLKELRLFYILSYRSSEVNQGELAQNRRMTSLVNNVAPIYGDVVVDFDSLSDEESLDFTKSFLKHHVPDINEKFIAQFHSRSDGVPLYCMELLTVLQDKKVVYKDNEQRWQGGNIPFGEMSSAMSGVIAERVEQLDPIYRRWLDLACVQGNVFITSTISECSQIEQSQLLFEFSKVLDKRLRLIEEMPPLYFDGKVILRYQFAHKLFQQYLYSELSFGEKHFLHKDVANSLEFIYEKHLEEKYSIIAYHFYRAMQYEEAFNYYMKACNYQYRIGAYDSCVKLLKRQLTTLPFISENSEPLKKEMQVLSLLVSCYIALYGYGAQQVKDINKRAEMIGQELDDDKTMFHIFWKEWSNYIVQGQLEESKTAIDKLYAISHKLKIDCVQRVELFHAAGVTEFNLGNFNAATTLLHKGLNTFKADNREEHLLNYGNDPEILITSWLAWSTLFSGEVTDSEKLLEKLEQLLEQSKHASSRAFGLIFKAMVYVFRNQPVNCLTVLDGFIDNEKYQMPFWQMWAKIIYKWVDCHVSSSYQSLESDIDEFVSIGGKTWKPYFYALWGDMLSTNNDKKADLIFEKTLEQIDLKNPRFYTLPILVLVKKHFQKIDKEKFAMLTTRGQKIVEMQQAFFWKKAF